MAPVSGHINGQEKTNRHKCPRDDCSFSATSIRLLSAHIKLHEDDDANALKDIHLMRVDPEPDKTALCLSSEEKMLLKSRLKEECFSLPMENDMPIYRSYVNTLPKEEDMAFGYLLADFRHPQMRSLGRVQKDSLTLAAAEMQRMLLQPIGGVKQTFIASYNEWASPTGVRATQVVRLWLNDGSPLEIEEGVPPGDNLVWTTFVNAPVLVMTANAKWTVLACSDCSLHVLVTETGAFSVNLQLDSLPAQLGMQDSHTFVLTSNGYFSCWELTKRKAFLSRIPVLDIVSNGYYVTVDYHRLISLLWQIPLECKLEVGMKFYLFFAYVHLHSISLSPSGSPFISFTNGSTYSYSANLQIWIPVDTCNGLSRLLGEAPSNDDLGEGAIATVLRNKKRPGVAPKTSMATRTWVGRAQMEGWIFAALDARSHKDLRPMVARYTDMLIMNNTTDKVRDLLSTLDSWVERARRKEKCDEWMDEEQMKLMREMVRQLISADTSMCEILKDLDNEGSMVF